MTVPNHDEYYTLEGEEKRMVLDFLNLLETTDTRIARHEWKEWDCQRNEWCKCPIALGVESQYGESNHDKLWEDSELEDFLFKPTLFTKTTLMFRLLNSMMFEYTVTVDCGEGSELEFHTKQADIVDLCDMYCMSFQEIATHIRENWGTLIPLYKAIENHLV